MFAKDVSFWARLSVNIRVGAVRPSVECESGDRALFCAADYNSKMGDKKLFFQKVNRFFQEVE